MSSTDDRLGAFTYCGYHQLTRGRGKTFLAVIREKAQFVAPMSPNAVRRGYVTEALNPGQPRDVTADRVDMSREVMDKHYDKATKNEQMERREDHLRDI